MPIVFFNTQDQEEVIVDAVHYMPDLLTDEVRSTGVEINEVPKPEHIEGKDSVLYFNTKTKEVYYKYFDRPLTQDEEIKSLKAENQSLNTAVVELYEIVLGGI